MKRPLHIWLLYLLGLAVVAPAFGWLTLKALELDRAEAIARQQAELEEDVSRALWRMDSLLTPLLAEEAARPEFVYRPVYATTDALGKKGEPLQELSPLLAQPPQFVRVHFEIHPDGRVTSPQIPVGEQSSWAMDNGALPATVATASARLAELKPVLDGGVLLAQLPAQPLPMVAYTASAPTPAPAVQPNPPLQTANPPVIANNYDDLSQQLVQQRESQLANPPAQQQALFSNPVNQPPAQQPASPRPQTTQQEVPASGPQVGQSQGGQELGQLTYGYNNSIESGRSQRIQSRIGNDLPNREAVLQAYAQKSFNEQRQNIKAAPSPLRVVEGVSRPIWLGDKLVLARRVQVGSETIVQGCWLDWDALQVLLKKQVEDLLPAVELTPVTAAEPIKLSRLLATIPVQLSVPLAIAQPAAWSPIRVSLVVAWSCLIVTALAGAIMLQSVLTLSERRGAFVSAVTHELRTPLTTFRMYAEMLAGGMVPDAQQRQHYLETLRVEADRLSHLVENVLQYARLERGRPGKRREETSLSSLLSRIETRLTDRAQQAGMKLAIELDEAVGTTTLATDPAAVEQILFNLVDNACKYAAGAADKHIRLSAALGSRKVQISVRDHGPGIAAAGRKKLFQPFSKSVHEAANSAPGVGLGLALSRRLASDLGGRLELQSPAGGGAAFVLTLPR